MAEQIEVLREGLTGHYTVDRAVGQGGMATVYLAKDVKNDRKVAIKVLKPELAASIGHERFLREIKLASQLQHPNILGMYESGEVPGGLVYYTMPFIEGESLRDRIDKEKQLNIEEAVRIVREAGEALGYAHSHGIVHRDIKPENILLMNGHALVADFGIAKAVEAAGGEKLTETGMAVGTPHYMSPEQALGGTIDGRSDQYSLACVLYECLIGQTPFDGPSPMAVLARHAMEQVPSMQVVRNAIPDSVEDVVFRAMEKTPADRFPSMKEFAEALEDAEADVHVQRTAARRAASQPRTAQHRMPTGAVRRATTPIEIPVHDQRKKWPMYAGGAVALLALLGGGFFFMKGKGGGAVKPSADAMADFKRVAVMYFEDQSPNHSLGYLTDGLTEDLIKELSTVQGLEVTSRNGVNAFRDPAIPRDSVARALRVGTIVVGSVEPSGPDKVRVTARLVDASGTEFKRSSFEQSTGDPIAMRDVLAGRVAEFLRERVGEEVRIRTQQTNTKSAEAWALVQRADRAMGEAETAAANGDATASSRQFAEADSLAKLAGEKDPSWNAPLVLRGSVYYRRSRLTNGDAVVAKPLIQQGLTLAETAVQRDNTDADALELRGNLSYWKYLLGLEPDAAAAKALLAGARKDLEDATKLNPLQAGAWASLSHLYSRVSSSTDVLLAARRAYEADAYLSNANTILSRLFTASYDLGQEVDAQHWCEELQRRFPADPKAASCQLWLMTMRGQEPDVAKAWKLATSEGVKSDPSGGSPEYQERQARMIVAAVLAKAGLKDSAVAVAKAARSNPAVDPTREFALFNAFVLNVAGDKQGAVKSLKDYLVANPSRRADLADDPGWWFRDLAADPAFKDAVGVR